MIPLNLKATFSGYHSVISEIITHEFISFFLNLCAAKIGRASEEIIISGECDDKIEKNLLIFSLFVSFSPLKQSKKIDFSLVSSTSVEVQITTE